MEDPSKLVDDFIKKCDKDKNEFKKKGEKLRRAIKKVIKKREEIGALIESQMSTFYKEKLKEEEEKLEEMEGAEEMEEDYNIKVHCCACGAEMDPTVDFGQKCYSGCMGYGADPDWLSEPEPLERTKNVKRKRDSVKGTKENPIVIDNDDEDAPKKKRQKIN
jgi:hypothetical protein